MQIKPTGALTGADRLNGRAVRVGAGEGGLTLGPARESDRLELSDHAVLLSRLRELPAVRVDLVDRVRAEIDSGAYESAERVDAALESLIRELTDEA